MTRYPSIQALRAIECVDRHGSLWRAAEELNVTRSAVSHQLRLLERDLGFKLLERSGNRTEVTARARSYAQDVRQALRMIAQSSSRVTQNGLSGTIAISCPAGFISAWFCFYIREFLEANPDITLKVINAPYMSDTSNPSVDAFITFGLDPNAKVNATELHKVEFSPLCSPAYLTRLGGTLDCNSLEHATLLHMGDFDDWKNWMTLQGFPEQSAERGICFPDMNMVHTAVLQGQGIAIGDAVLWRRELRNGQLMRPFEQSLYSETKYYFCTPHDCADNPLTEELLKWLISCINSRDLTSETRS